jgi:hypothetical protein
MSVKRVLTAGVGCGQVLRTSGLTLNEIGAADSLAFCLARAERVSLHLLVGYHHTRGHAGHLAVFVDRLIAVNLIPDRARRIVRPPAN